MVNQPSVTWEILEKAQFNLLCKASEKADQFAALDRVMYGALEQKRARTVSLSEERKRELYRTAIKKLCAAGRLEFVREIREGDKVDTICLMFSPDGDEVAIGVSCQSDDDQLDRGEGRYHAFRRANRNMRLHSRDKRRDEKMKAKGREVERNTKAKAFSVAHTHILSEVMVALRAIRERHPNPMVRANVFVGDSASAIVNIMDRRLKALEKKQQALAAPEENAPNVTPSMESAGA